MKQTLTKAMRTAGKWAMDAIVQHLALAIGTFIMGLFGKGITKFQANRAMKKERKLATEVESVEEVIEIEPEVASESDATETAEEPEMEEIIEETNED